MSAQYSPPRMGRSASHRAGYSNPGLRISDADRAEAADRLSKHYGDGRLDKAEFDERLSQAMSAQTHADLSGLFADLPGAAAPEAPAPKMRHGRFGRIFVLVLLVVIVAAAGHAIMQSFIPWLLIGLLAVLWLRHGPWRR